jgi:nicotinate phosphoribosyltransferase
MKIRPIITSLLDNDLYTFTVGQVVHKLFPTAQVKYQFINRSKTAFPKGFADKLREQLQCMKSLFLSYDERKWLEARQLFSPEYLDFLSDYRFNPDEITIIEDDNGNLTAEFTGTWVNLIMWEVPFLALVSELYYIETGAEKSPDYRLRIAEKAKKLSRAGCKWMEFGTRRRFDFVTQDAVVAIQRHYEGFLGTSNMLLAKIYEVPVNGTMSHQGPMAMQALHGVVMSNSAWRQHWREVYGDKLNTFLPDTLSTKVFLRDYTKEEALLWNLRQDSGNPYDWMDLVLAFLRGLDIQTKDKKFVFSDSLNVDKGIAITKKYSEDGIIILGIGTDMSNDCGHKALSIVIKLIAADFGNGWVDVVKLSDDPVKHTGKPEVIAKTKIELGLV